MPLIALLTGLMLIAALCERALHARARGKVGIRILVNGTRGKTSVTRLMAAALNEAGIRTFAKCTGSNAAVIAPDAAEAPLPRRRGARLTEMIPFFRRAAKAGAQAVVVECMAVRPESQAVFSGALVKPTLILMTNARVDHIDEMGDNVDETVRVLAFSVPPNTPVISQETKFGLCAQPLIVPHAQVDDALLARFAYPVFRENVSLVLAAAAHLGISRESAIRGMLNARPDVGMAGPFARGGCLVINAFAANDAASTAALLQQVEQAKELENAPILVLFNNRADREYRLQSFLEVLHPITDRCLLIMALGEHQTKVARYFSKRTGIPCRAATVAEAADAIETMQGIALCMGNIKGDGAVLIEGMMRGEEGE